MSATTVYKVNHVIDKGGNDSKPEELVKLAFFSKADIAPKVALLNESLTGSAIIERVIVEEVTVHDETF